MTFWSFPPRSMWPAPWRWCWNHSWLWLMGPSSLSSDQGSKVHRGGTCQLPLPGARGGLEDRGSGSPPRVFPVASLPLSEGTSHRLDTCCIHKVCAFTNADNSILVILVFILPPPPSPPFQTAGQKKKLGWRCFQPNTDFYFFIHILMCWGVSFFKKIISNLKETYIIPLLWYFLSLRPDHLKTE